MIASVQLYLVQYYMILVQITFTIYSFDLILFPTPIKDLNNMSINVYGLDEKNNVYLIRISKKENYDKMFDLL